MFRKFFEILGIIKKDSKHPTPTPNVDEQKSSPVESKKEDFNTGFPNELPKEGLIESVITKTVVEVSQPVDEKSPSAKNDSLIQKKSSTKKSQNGSIKPKKRRYYKKPKSSGKKTE